MVTTRFRLALGVLGGLTLLWYGQQLRTATPRFPAVRPPHFPARIFDLPGEEPGNGANLERWFADGLGTVAEPSLFDLPAERARQLTAYRLMFLPAFKPAVVVRVERDGDQLRWRRVVTGTSESGDLTYLKSDQSGRPTRGAWERLTRQVAASGFWYLATRGEHPHSSDQAHWLIEGLDKGQYRAVVRWAPGPGGFLDLGTAMLALAEAEAISAAPGSDPAHDGWALTTVALAALLAGLVLFRINRRPADTTRRA